MNDDIRKYIKMCEELVSSNDRDFMSQGAINLKEVYNKVLVGNHERAILPYLSATFELLKFFVKVNDPNLADPYIRKYIQTRDYLESKIGEYDFNNHILTEDGIKYARKKLEIAERIIREEPRSESSLRQHNMRISCKEYLGGN